MNEAEETSATIAQWADQTFGPTLSNARIASRANEEMAELLRVLTREDGNVGAVEEAADVVIVLCRLADRMGWDLWVAVEHKMRINRKRKWNVGPDGHGYHVKDHVTDGDAK